MHLCTSSSILLILLCTHFPYTPSYEESHSLRRKPFSYTFSGPIAPRASPPSLPLSPAPLPTLAPLLFAPSPPLLPPVPTSPRGPLALSNLSSLPLFPSFAGGAALLFPPFLRSAAGARRGLRAVDVLRQVATLVQDEEALGLGGAGAGAGCSVPKTRNRYLCMYIISKMTRRQIYRHLYIRILLWF